MDELVSKAEVIKIMKDNWHNHNGDWAMQESIDAIKELPSVTPQEPTNNDLTCAYAKGVYDTREETATIFDKLRAEIEQEPYVSKLEVLDIIDKYKAETEAE